MIFSFAFYSLFMSLWPTLSSKSVRDRCLQIRSLPGGGLHTASWEGQGSGCAWIRSADRRRFQLGATKRGGFENPVVT